MDAPHKPRDNDKLAAMVEALRSGGTLPPVVAYGERAFCGSHRIAAYEHALRAWQDGLPGWDGVAEPSLTVLELTDEEYTAACDLLNVEYLEDERDCNEVCRAIMAVARDEIKHALADQVD